MREKKRQNNKWGIKSDLLFEKVKTYFPIFWEEFGTIIIEKDDKILKIFKPNPPEVENYLLYTIIIGASRESSFVSNSHDLNNLVEYVTEIFGNDVSYWKRRNLYLSCELFCLWMDKRREGFSFGVMVDMFGRNAKKIVKN